MRTSFSALAAGDRECRRRAARCRRRVSIGRMAREARAPASRRAARRTRRTARAAQAFAGRRPAAARRQARRERIAALERARAAPTRRRRAPGAVVGGSRGVRELLGNRAVGLFQRGDALRQLHDLAVIAGTGGRRDCAPKPSQPSCRCGARVADRRIGVVGAPSQRDDGIGQRLDSAFHEPRRPSTFGSVATGRGALSALSSLRRPRRQRVDRLRDRCSAGAGRAARSRNCVSIEASRGVSVATASPAAARNDQPDRQDHQQHRGSRERTGHRCRPRKIGRSPQCRSDGGGSAAARGGSLGGACGGARRRSA